MLSTYTALTGWQEGLWNLAGALDIGDVAYGEGWRHTQVVEIPSFARNVTRAALLDVDFYNEAERDPGLDVQALLVVLFANVLGGIGSVIATEATDTNGAVALALGAVAGAFTGVIGWLVWSAIANFAGTRFFGGTADFGEMRRVIGFSFAPLAIGVVPWLGFVGAAWTLIAAMIAVREGLDFSTQRAIATVVVGWGSWLLIAVAAQWILNVDLTLSRLF